MFVIEMIFESFGSFPLLLRAIHGGVFVRLPRYGKWKLLDCDQSKFLEENIDLFLNQYISADLNRALRERNSKSISGEVTLF